MYCGHRCRARRAVSSVIAVLSKAYGGDEEFASEAIGASTVAMILNYYLKNSNGINITISTGPGDIFGSNHSHRGIDISVSSISSNSGFDLCTEGEMCLISNNIEKTVSDLYTDTIKPELFLNHYDPMLLLTLTNDNRENDTFMNKAIIYSYMNLKNTAKAQNSSLIQESLISPYGGLDVELKSVNQILFESINNYKEDPVLYKKILTLFNYDTDYITELIDDTVHALYIANHSDEYFKLFNLMDEKLYKEIDLTKEEAAFSHCHAVQKSKKAPAHRMHSTQFSAY